mmetsp:Transcript_87695/g.204034  ORF Transcript_87695/g.204034 Transcript_87695/m.204034 type:complete len:118 (+) Transcript_87695:539-892(+)
MTQCAARVCAVPQELFVAAACVALSMRPVAAPMAFLSAVPLVRSAEVAYRCSQTAGPAAVPLLLAPPHSEGAWRSHSALLGAMVRIGGLWCVGGDNSARHLRLCDEWTPASVSELAC